MGYNTYFVGDTHFHHENLILGTSKWKDKSGCRNFKSIESHDELLIKNINKCVKEKDTLYHLGDWSLGGKDKIYEFWKKLNCKNIHLLEANHDIHQLKDSEIVIDDNKIINVRSLYKSYNSIIKRKIGDNEFIMCHYPIKSWENQKKGSIHLYAHTHQELNYHKNAVCVSIDCHPKFRPFSKEEILNIINNRI